MGGIDENMKKTVKWLASFAVLSLVMALLCVFIGNLSQMGEDKDTVTVLAVEEKVQVIVDAGHGGEDGGCVGADGTPEKDLNLAIAKKVCTILRALGVNAVMSREEDIMLYDMYSDLSDYSGVKKTYDLRNRVRLATESEASLFVSIHMNKFPDEKYSGFQTYYSDNDSESVDAAQNIQKAVKELLQKDNERQIKKATSEIYVLHRAKVPSVLCECGFLSNPGELERLKDEKYQKEISFCIAMGIIESLREREG